MIPTLSDKEILANLSKANNPNFPEYFAFYSSWFGGITTNPQLMLVPVDDHMVHRGDGVFEGMKAVKGSVYLMKEHLTRLSISADKIFLKLPFDMQHVKEVILATVKASGHQDVSIRVYLSRGPGNFTVSPYDSIATQLYVAVTKLIAPAPEKYSKGVILGKSSIPVKPNWMAQVKS
jgi:4-amino-4-deoxychorismate lyase